MSDAGDWPYTGEETKNCRRHRGAERKSFPLLNEFAICETVSQEKRARRGVLDIYRRLQLPRGRKQGGEIDSGVPINTGLKILPINPCYRLCGIVGIDKGQRVATIVEHINDFKSVLPAPSANTKRCIDREPRVPRSKK